MKRFLITLALLPALAACGNATATYSITTDVQDEQLHNSLLFASMRVVERRMASVGEEPIDVNLDRSGSGTLITVQAENQSAIDLLTETLTEPFNFMVMKEVPQEQADITVEGHGGFAETGVTGSDIVWLQASEENGGKGRVTINFTDKGREKMSEIFEQNTGKNIGLFVRGQLVSKLLVETDQLKDDIIITDIPSASLAKVFADDVNVGLHVTFTPVE